MNQQDIQKIFAILQPVWPATGLDKAAIPAWTLALDGMDSGLLQAAAAEWVRSSKWFPKPFELITLANDIEAEQQRGKPVQIPERTEQLSVSDAKRLIGKLLDMGLRRAHPNLIAAAYGQPATVFEKVSEPIPGELIHELTRGAA